MEDLVAYAGIAGVLLMLVSWIWVVVLAFKESLGWGLSTLILNPVALVYALMRAKKCKVPLIIFAFGLALYVQLLMR